MAQPKRDVKSNDCLGTGRRKTAVARVRIRPGSGQILVNGRHFEEYFRTDQERRLVVEALDAVNHRTDVDVLIRASGGGPRGQAGAARMGIARALLAYDTEAFTPLRGGGFLTRDSRMKERKKYGLRGARRGTQFSKR